MKKVLLLIFVFVSLGFSFSFTDTLSGLHIVGLVDSINSGYTQLGETGILTVASNGVCGYGVTTPRGMTEGIWTIHFLSNTGKTLSYQGNTVNLSGNWSFLFTADVTQEILSLFKNASWVRVKVYNSNKAIIAKLHTDGFWTNIETLNLPFTL
jgi:hypothetical protein